MAKESGKKSFLDFFKMKDLDDDEFDDDLFDDDDDDDDDEDYVKPRSSKPKASYGRSNNQQDRTQTAYNSRASYTSNTQSHASYKAQPQSNSYSAMKPQQARPVQNNKLVDFNNQRQQRSDSFKGRSEVYVIKPQEISESQTVADFLKNGKTIVINMEGLELIPAQRIIDFIGGACYALDGTLQAISANIFIAAPNSIEVSGDLREEILNESTISPQLGQF